MKSDRIELQQEDIIIFSLFLLFEEWLQRTVEKAELISRKEYLLKSSFQLKITNDFSDKFKILSDEWLAYWKEHNKEIAERVSVLQKESSETFKKILNENNPISIIFPLVINPKKPLINFDIWREDQKKSLEVIPKPKATQLTLNLLNNFFIYAGGSTFIEKHSDLILCLLNCFPKFIYERKVKKKSLSNFFLEELEGYFEEDEQKTFNKILKKKSLMNKIQKIENRCHRIEKKFQKEVHPFHLDYILTHPLLLIRDNLKINRNYYEDFDLSLWFDGFIKKAKEYLDGLEALHKHDKALVHYLDFFVSSYILYLESSIEIDKSFLIKFSVRKFEMPDPEKYPTSKREVKTTIEQLKRDKTSLRWRILLSKGFCWIVRIYFLYVKMPFIFAIDLLGIGKCYHFEFSTKDTEVHVQSYCLNYDTGDEVYTRTVDKFFGVSQKSTGYLHLYTSRQEFLSKEGKEISPNSFSLIIWPNIFLLSPLIFLSVILLEILSFLFLATNSIFPEQGNNFIQLGLISLVVTLSLRYRPGPIAESLIRRWKRSTVIGLLLYLLCVISSIAYVLLMKPCDEQAKLANMVIMIIGVSLLIIRISWEFAFKRIWYKFKEKRLN